MYRHPKQLVMNEKLPHTLTPVKLSPRKPSEMESPAKDCLGIKVQIESEER